MLILVTGGSASGKSSYAEGCLNQEKEKVYIATMQPFDAECEKKILKHQKLRLGKGFETVEVYGLLKENEKLWKSDLNRKGVLLECMSNYLSNCLFGSALCQYEDELVNVMFEELMELKERAKTLVVVTNEVFSDGVSYDEDTLGYLKKLGELNCRIAAAADKVVEAVCGIPVVRKDEVSNV